MGAGLNKLGYRLLKNRLFVLLNRRASNRQILFEIDVGKNHGLSLRNKSTSIPARKDFSLKIKISSSKTVLKLDLTEAMGEQPLVFILDS